MILFASNYEFFDEIFQVSLSIELDNYILIIYKRKYLLVYRVSDYVSGPRGKRRNENNYYNSSQNNVPVIDFIIEYIFEVCSNESPD